MKNKLVVGALTLSLVSLGGCAVTSEPLTEEERSARIQSDLEKIFADQEPVTGPIDLHEAMARALKYNLDHRAKLMERALSEAEVEVAGRDFLPRIAASAGYTTRNNDAGSSSESLITGTQSLEPSTSVEKTRRVADVTIAWNVLDFGVSYATAKQASNRVLIAEERRRKVIQNIMQDVRVAFWQAASAQRLEQATNDLLADTRAALRHSRQMEAEGLQPPLTSLEYQRQILQTLRDLLRLRQQLSVSKTELASLINLRPGTDYELAVPDDLPELQELGMTLEEMEREALANRPELREEDYQARIDALEVRKAVRRMFPGIEVVAGAHYDSNRFLVNDNWVDASLSVTWNLFNLFSGPAIKRRAEARQRVSELRRMAMSVAVLTQVNVAVQRFEAAREDFKLADNLREVNGRISKTASAQQQSSAGDELSVIRRKANALVAEMQRYQAYAEWQDALGRIENSLGKDPLPEEVSAHDIESLSLAIQAHITQVQPPEWDFDLSSNVVKAGESGPVFSVK